MLAETDTQTEWESVCALYDITPYTGVCALVGEEHVAVFRTSDEQLYAVQNYCPFGKASVLSRGLVGTVGAKTVVASPLYKQQYDLATGVCLDDPSIILKTFAVRLNNGMVQVK